MARPEKVAKVNEVAERFEAANATLLTEYSGLSVSALADLRRQLRESDAEYHVVKNTLTRRAAVKAGVEVPDDVLTGPTAITFCAGDPVAAAKVLRRFSKDHPGLVMKAGILEGSLLDAGETDRLADLESREEMLAKLAGMFGTIVAQPARLAIANLEKAARIFGALQDKKPSEALAPADGQAEEAEEAAPAAEAAEAGDAVQAETASTE